MRYVTFLKNNSLKSMCCVLTTHLNSDETHFKCSVDTCGSDYRLDSEGLEKCLHIANIIWVLINYINK